MRTIRSTLLVSLVGLAVAVAVADSGRPVKARTYSSSNDEFHLTVDPRWTDRLEMQPLLTLRTRDGELLWKRVPSQFEEFHYPMHACVSDDGQYVVFGGYSVHNVGHYREGLRFYGPTGRLIRFYSRRDLPAGVYSVSTAHWYDAERSRLVGSRFLLYTPERDVPTVFAVETGEVMEGSVVAGQGDDEEHWRRRWQTGDSDG
jgi:hypothetical protein